MDRRRVQAAITIHRVIGSQHKTFCQFVVRQEPFAMEIQQLQYFAKVADCLSFSEAARQLDVSQPALSRSVAKLEAELGQPVFERGGRKLQLTEAGELLRERTQQMVALIEDTKAQIVDDGQTGRLRIAAIPTVAPYFLPQLLKQTNRTLPKARVEIHECTTDQCIKRCSEGEVDAAMVALPIEAKHLEVESLFEEELMLVTPKDHPLAKQKKVNVADVKPYPFVLLGEAHCLSDDIRGFCQRKAFQPVTTGETNQLTTVLELVALGHGVSLIPEMTRRTDRSRQRVYRSLTGDRPSRRIALMTNPYRFHSQLLVKFLELTRDFAHRHAEACDAGE